MYEFLRLRGGVTTTIEWYSFQNRFLVVISIEYAIPIIYYVEYMYVYAYVRRFAINKSSESVERNSFLNLVFAFVL